MQQYGAYCTCTYYLTKSNYLGVSFLICVIYPVKKDSVKWCEMLVSWFPGQHIRSSFANFTNILTVHVWRSRKQEQLWLKPQPTSINQQTLPTTPIQNQILKTSQKMSWKYLNAKLMMSSVSLPSTVTLNTRSPMIG